MHHLEVWEHERRQLEPTQWDSWIARAEMLVGHDIDGEDEEGYSLDGAYDAFEEGLTPEQYVGSIKGK